MFRRDRANPKIVLYHRIDGCETEMLATLDCRTHIFLLQLFPQLRTCFLQIGLRHIEDPEHLHIRIDIVLFLFIIGEFLVILILDFSFVSLWMHVNVVSMTGKDFSPRSTETRGNSFPSLPGLLSRCTQSNVQKRGILYPSFSQCSNNINAFMPLYSRPERFFGHCNAPSVNQGFSSPCGCSRFSRSSFPRTGQEPCLRCWARRHSFSVPSHKRH